MKAARDTPAKHGKRRSSNAPQAASRRSRSDCTATLPTSFATAFHLCRLLNRRCLFTLPGDDGVEAGEAGAPAENETLLLALAGEEDMVPAELAECKDRGAS